MTIAGCLFDILVDVLLLLLILILIFGGRIESGDGLACHPARHDYYNNKNNICGTEGANE